MIGLRARYAELVRRHFGEEEIAPPGILLEQDRPEWSYLKKERLWVSGPIGLVASVGNFSHFRFRQRNPKLLDVIQGIVALAAAASTQLSLREDAGGAPAAEANLLARDFRSPAPSITSLLEQSGAGASGTELALLTTHTLLDIPFTSMPYILVSGHTLDVFNLTANTTTKIWAWGYELPLEPEEIADQ